jgi:photosystem II stability/assembly factor-like uncharacterized protein
MPHLSSPVIVTAGVLTLGIFPGSLGARETPAATQVQLRQTEQASGTQMLLQAISPVDDEVVWVSGHGGTFLRTVDGGLNWSARVGPGADTLQFRDIDAFDARTAYLMSAGPGPLSRIYRTDDGGDSWNLQFLNEHSEGFFDCMAFWDSRRGILYGDAIEGTLFVLRTEDGGASWDRVPEEGLPIAQEGEGGFAASGSCVTTGSGGRAWIATGNGEQARVLWTEDEGRTWQASSVPVAGGPAAGLTTIDVLDDALSIALGGVLGQDTVGVDNVILSSDGGRTWRLGGRPDMVGPVYGSSWVPGAETPTAFAVGPAGADYSLDGGLTWRAAARVPYWAVSFVSPSAGWAVGPGGRITHLAFLDP